MARNEVWMGQFKDFMSCGDLENRLNNETLKFSQTHRKRIGRWFRLFTRGTWLSQSTITTGTLWQLCHLQWISETLVIWRNWYVVLRYSESFIDGTRRHPSAISMQHACINSNVTDRLGEGKSNHIFPYLENGA